MRELRELELGDIVLGDLQYESEASEMDSEGPITVDMSGHDSDPPMVVTYRLTGMSFEVLLAGKAPAADRL